jgi:hypothetical protein
MKLPPSSIQRVVASFESLAVVDPRRKRRVQRTVEKLAAQPRATLPEAMGSEADTEGAYRLMNSGHLTMDDLNEAHARATLKRALSIGRVLAIHDTTACEFKHANPEDVGYLTTGKPGFMAHYALIVAADGSKRPLGVASIECISRDKPPARRKAKGRSSRKRSGDETVRNKKRESTRWWRGFERASNRLAGCQVVHVADREGDNYELFARAIEHGARFVIRARVLERQVGTNEGTKESLGAAVEASRTVLVREVAVSPRKASSSPQAAKSHPSRSARRAHLEVSATRVTLYRPRYQSSDLPESIEVNVVRVFEPNPPEGEDPIEWVILTNEAVSTPSEVAAVVDAYCGRWLIEECNKALKTGCRYEDRQFESRDALLTLLALLLPIACELLWLRACCRSQPQRPATDVLTPLQLKILAAMGSRKLPDQPTVHDALWAVAALGGHLTTNGEPGWLVLHRGMTELLAYERGWAAALSQAGLPISR